MYMQVLRCIPPPNASKSINSDELISISRTLHPLHFLIIFLIALTNIRMADLSKPATFSIDIT